MTTPDPSTWRVHAHAAGIAGHRHVDTDLVELRLDRRLKSGKMDTVPLTAAQAIKLATDLLDAVQVLERRKR